MPNRKAAWGTWIAGDVLIIGAALALVWVFVTAGVVFTLSQTNIILIAVLVLGLVLVALGADWDWPGKRSEKGTR